MSIYHKAISLTANSGFTTGPSPKGVLLMPGDSCTVKDLYGNVVGISSGIPGSEVPFLLPMQISECTAIVGSPKVLF